ncbi:hypothetical protein PUN28_019608 [Cardiocondyla obscurior]|uniref:Transmembrane protein n=1 Tax=Cardiocondyla obscurior TaxID=286306 RepID=A0AAW2EBK7_9HYME
MVFYLFFFSRRLMTQNNVNIQNYTQTDKQTIIICEKKKKQEKKRFWVPNINVLYILFISTVVITTSIAVSICISCNTRYKETVGSVIVAY